MRMKTSDNELAVKAADGDADAYRVLLERHYDTIFRFALRSTGVREDAEDIAQVVCMSLCGKLGSFRGEARFTTWLYRVVLNAVRDSNRRKISRDRLHQTYAELEDLTRGEAVESARDIAWLYELLNRVSEDLRETAILVLAEGLSHAQAAETLNIKESTVSWRMHELRKKLKALAEEEA